MVLSAKSKQALKARAHALKPVVLLGNQGLTAAVSKEIDRALTDHELIKIRIPIQDRDERRELAATVCADLGAELVQMIGSIAVLYRKGKE